jgi:hypothetical protein
VKRDKVDTGPNFTNFHFFNEPGTVNSEHFQIEAQNVKVPSVFYLRALGRNLQFLYFAECLVVSAGNLQTTSLELWELAQLM